jgi:hypothetical protein
MAEVHTRTTSRYAEEPSTLPNAAADAGGVFAEELADSSSERDKNATEEGVDPVVEISDHRRHFMPSTETIFGHCRRPDNPPIWCRVHGGKR